MHTHFTSLPNLIPSYPLTSPSTSYPYPIKHPITRHTLLEVLDLLDSHPVPVIIVIFKLLEVLDTHPVPVIIVISHTFHSSRHSISHSRRTLLDMLEVLDLFDSHLFGVRLGFVYLSSLTRSNCQTRQPSPRQTTSTTINPPSFRSVKLSNSTPITLTIASHASNRIRTYQSLAPSPCQTVKLNTYHSVTCVKPNTHPSIFTLFPLSNCHTRHSVLRRLHQTRQNEYTNVYLSSIKLVKLSNSTPITASHASIASNYFHQHQSLIPSLYQLLEVLDLLDTHPVPVIIVITVIILTSHPCQLLDLFDPHPISVIFVIFKLLEVLDSHPVPVIFVIFKLLEVLEVLDSHPVPVIIVISHTSHSSRHSMSYSRRKLLEVLDLLLITHHTLLEVLDLFDSHLFGVLLRFVNLSSPPTRSHCHTPRCQTPRPSPHQPRQTTSTNIYLSSFHPVILSHSTLLSYSLLSHSMLCQTRRCHTQCCVILSYSLLCHTQHCCHTQCCCHTVILDTHHDNIRITRVKPLSPLSIYHLLSLSHDQIQYSSSHHIHQTRQYAYTIFYLPSLRLVTLSNPTPITPSNASNHFDTHQSLFSLPYHTVKLSIHHYNSYITRVNTNTPSSIYHPFTLSFCHTQPLINTITTSNASKRICKHQFIVLHSFKLNSHHSIKRVNIHTQTSIYHPLTLSFCHTHQPSIDNPHQNNSKNVYPPSLTQSNSTMQPPHHIHQTRQYAYTIFYLLSLHSVILSYSASHAHPSLSHPTIREYIHYSLYTNL